MTEVVYSHTTGHRQSYDMDTFSDLNGQRSPLIEMVPNPDFRMPMHSTTDLVSNTEARDFAQRPRSLQIPPGLSSSARSAHRRTVSNLPTFSFNAVDSSGLQDGGSPSPPLTPDETTIPTPSRRGHRRGGSEFVGGDSRLGMENTISTSPTKASSALPIPGSTMAAAAPTPGRRGHAHRRSAAMSSHDVTSIMNAPDTPRLSSSLPNSPLEHPAYTPTLYHHPAPSDMAVHGLSDPFGTPAHDDSVDISNRPRVGFSDNVEYIPRPLSTISSETEDSMSTRRGHSVNNSISSVLSQGTPSPNTRNLRSPLSTTFEDAPVIINRRPLDISKRIEREGAWLKGDSTHADLVRPLSQPCAPSPPLVLNGTEDRIKHRSSNCPAWKKSSLSHALGFDRRRSEPSISAKAGDISRLSSISLPGASALASDDDGEISDVEVPERPSSRRRLKSWARGRFTRKGRETRKSQSFDISEAPMLISPHVTDYDHEQPGLGIQEAGVAEAETDLDAVLGSQNESNSPPLGIPIQPRIDVQTPTPSYHSSFQSSSSDDLSPILDLDAALGPFKTPPLGQHRIRRELHSSRLAKDFAGPGGHYHRRTESAPLLAQFESPMRNSVQHVMADVFEEEEDEEPLARPHTQPSGYDGSGIGIHVVDSISTSGTMLRLDRKLAEMRARSGELEIATISTEMARRSLTPLGERRGSRLAEETIIEEASPTEIVDIVHAEDEPRCSSQTKSSDSSDATTVTTANPSDVAMQSHPPPFLAATEAFTDSTFSSPDLARGRGSFDGSRLGTSASSIADNRTLNSYTMNEHGHDFRVSNDDVPSLTSSQSTMISARRNFSGDRAPTELTITTDADVAGERRRKRASIQSLSQLVGGPFGSKTKVYEVARPHTAIDAPAIVTKKKEHRLKKLLFWKSKVSSRLSDSTHA